jgi:hypothetical protein
VPVSIFTAGLVLATLCAFITYLNDQFLPLSERASRWNAAMEIEVLFPLFQTDPRLSQRKKEMAANTEIIQSSDRRIKISYWGGLIAGWGSAACFVASCIFMALNMR